MNANVDELVGKIVEALEKNFVIGICDTSYPEDISSATSDDIAKVVRDVLEPAQHPLGQRERGRG